MNISYEKIKSLKDIETTFKKYPRTNKNRFIRNLLDLLNPRTPLQMVSELSNLKSMEEIYIRIRFRVKKFTYKNIKLIMRRPFKNREAFRKIKESLISNYSEYISLNKTKENPQKLAYLITLISSIESKLITHLKSRRMRYIPLNYDKIRFRYPPRYYKYNLK